MLQVHVLRITEVKSQHRPWPPPALMLLPQELHVFTYSFLLCFICGSCFPFLKLSWWLCQLPPSRPSGSHRHSPHPPHSQPVLPTLTFDVDTIPLLETYPHLPTLPVKTRPADSPEFSSWSCPTGLELIISRLELGCLIGI